MLASFALLTACGGRPDAGALALNTAPAADARVSDILIATTRKRDSRPDTYFNGERSTAISYAQASISVPPTHEAGAIEWPDSLPGDPEKAFVARSAGYLADKAAFKAKVNARLAALPRGERNVLVFIHGYNTRFPEALYRFTQIVHDSRFKGVPVMFTWASRGKLKDYVYDLNSAAVARSALEETLVELSGSRAEHITVLAHSMGNWLLMETAVQARPENRRLLSTRIDDIVLAAPDIDIDLFKAQLKKLGKPPRPFTVIVSRDDKALRISRTIAGGKERVGAYSDDQELAELGAVVIDVTDLDSLDSTNHSKFAQLAQLRPEFRETFGRSVAASTSDQYRGANLGEDLGSFVGSATQAAVTLPIRIITAPFSYAGGP
ncbi:alpha/beta hydrolase [Roseibium sp. Sym1]|uniref:alpha/beta hydrolase n=1 Tax=Roseibium sp. Sym1 TaxID=3016006 RepID=UPI0022B2C4EA|nr:alpha/beta hydrolase [Roseibium sp. Sym1]